MASASSRVVRARAVAAEMRTLGLESSLPTCWFAIALVAILNTASAVAMLASL